MFNKVTLIGRLGADPEIRYTPDGLNVANLRIATDEQWKDKSGEKKTKTEWHRLIAFGKTAEIIGQYLQKGRLIFVEGRLQTRSWEDKDKIVRYTTEVIIQTIKMLDKANGNGNGNNRKDEPEPPPPDMGAGPLSEEDVPF